SRRWRFILAARPIPITSSLGQQATQHHTGDPQPIGESFVVALTASHRIKKLSHHLVLVGWNKLFWLRRGFDLLQDPLHTRPHRLVPFAPLLGLSAGLIRLPHQLV